MISRISQISQIGLIIRLLSCFRAQPICLILPIRPIVRASHLFFTNFRETDLTYSNSNVYIGGMGAES